MVQRTRTHISWWVLLQRTKGLRTVLNAISRRRTNALCSHSWGAFLHWHVTVAFQLARDLRLWKTREERANFEPLWMLLENSTQLESTELHLPWFDKSMQCQFERPGNITGLRLNLTSNKDGSCDMQVYVPISFMSPYSWSSSRAFIVLRPFQPSPLPPTTTSSSLFSLLPKP